MKKSIKKVVNRLKPLVGHEIIRIKPVFGDYSYTSEPVTLLGFTDKGELIVRCELCFRKYKKIMSIRYTDPFWISYRKAKRAKNNPLNKWKGRYVKRIVPIEEPYYDISFMNPADRYRLIGASKHHVFLQDGGRMCIKNLLYANPKDWALNE